MNFPQRGLGFFACPASMPLPVSPAVRALMEKHGVDDFADYEAHDEFLFRLADGMAIHYDQFLNLRVGVGRK